MTETNMTETQFLREKLVEKEQQCMRMVESFSRLMYLVNSQADDAPIWYIKDSVLLRPEPAQVAIRALHAAIENERPAFTHTGYPKLDPAPPPGETL